MVMALSSGVCVGFIGFFHWCFHPEKGKSPSFPSILKDEPGLFQFGEEERYVRPEMICRRYEELQWDYFFNIRVFWTFCLLGTGGLNIGDCSSGELVIKLGT